MPSNTTPLKILAVESDPTICLTLEHILAGQSDMVLTACAPSCREAQKRIADYSFQVLLVDLNLPDGFGLELICQAAALTPAVDIMVLANSNEDPHIVSAIESGAMGYVLKRDLEKNLVAAIRLLKAGGSPVSPAVAKSVLRALRSYTTQTLATERQPLESNPLSERETEILQLLAKGMSFNEIGDILTISPHTVTAHIKKIYRKLQVHSRGEAVYEAVQMGILP